MSLVTNFLLVSHYQWIHLLTNFLTNSKPINTCKEEWRTNILCLSLLKCVGAKEQLLYRLRRFEKLAELDPIELERKLLEGSDSDDQGESEDSNNDEPMLSYTNHNVEQTETKAFNQPRVQSHPPKRSTDPMSEEKNDVICLGNREVVLGRVCKRLDFSKEVKFATIDMMIELDFNKDVDGWKTFSEQGEETVADIELAIFGMLVDELSEELYPVDEHFLDVDYVHFGCT